MTKKILFSQKKVRFMLYAALLLLLMAALGGTALALSDVAIYDIQGSGHLSPYDGQEVTTTGIVTALAFNGYYVQDATGDGNDETADGIFVFDTRDVQPAVGDLVSMTGEVSEFISGGAATGNLSTTQMAFPDITIESSGNALPAPVIIGTSGRIPPAVDVISESEEPTNLQDVPGIFNPDNDGIDFYESLEGMLVTVEDPVAVSAIRSFSAFSSEFFTLPNGGAHVEPADARTARGGINLQPDPNNTGDQNPERVQIQLDGTLFPFDVPEVTVNDTLGDITGVVGYSFGNFEVNALHEFTVTSGELEQEVSELQTPRGQRRHAIVTVASYNVLNLSPDASDENQRIALADQIINNLGRPDVIALQEIQDSSGEVDDGTIDSRWTLRALAGAVRDAGGPNYRFFDVAPEDGTSGGAPGGNIRNAFFFNPVRVQLLRYRSLTPDVLAAAGVTYPDAFAGTRNPLLATFYSRGQTFTVINNHLTSRFGSTPIFGGPQPFVQAGEIERGQQTLALNEYVYYLLENKYEHIVVLGDMNTMEFTNEMTETLPGVGADKILNNLIDTLTDDNVYTYNFEGNSQVLDNYFVTDDLVDDAVLDIVHTNVDFPRVDDSVASDHEPLVAQLDLR